MLISLCRLLQLRSLCLIDWSELEWAGLGWSIARILLLLRLRDMNEVAHMSCQ